MTLLYAILAIPALAAAVMSFRRPYFGLLATLAVNPLEYFLHLPPSLSIGRLVALVAFLGWFNEMGRRGGIAPRIKALRVTRLVLPFVLVCLLGVLLNFQSRLDDYLRVLTLALLAAMSMMVEDLVDTEEKMHGLLLVVALSSTMYAIPAVGSYLGLGFFSNGAGELSTRTGQFRYSGIADNPNALALSVNMGLFVLFVVLARTRSLFKTLLLGGVAGILIAGLILAASRTHFIGLFVYIGALAGLSLLYPARGLRKVTLSLLLFAALLSSLYFRAPERVQRRLVVVGSGVEVGTERRADFTRFQMTDSLDMLTRYPLFGVGLGNFQIYSTRGPGHLDAHDTVSAVLGETGVLGTLAFCALLVVSAGWLRAGIRVSRQLSERDMYYTSLGFLAALIALLISGFGGFVIFYSRLLWLIVGIAAVVQRWALEHAPPAPPGRELRGVARRAVRAREPRA